MQLPVAKFGRFKADEKPVKKFWEQDSILSPISATRALIGGVRGQSISNTGSSIDVSRSASIPNKMRSNHAILGQIATQIANQRDKKRFEQ